MKPPKYIRMTLAAGLLLAVFALLSGCAAPPPKPAQRETVFYPQPPDPPRIQHLATFEGEADLGAPKSAMAEFLLGEEKRGESLIRPYGTALYDGKIYVADSRAGGLAIFDLVKRAFTLFAGSGGGRMQRPINVTVDTDGTKYVTDAGRNQVLVFDRGDRYLNAFGEKGDFRPVDTAIAGERLYVVDIAHHEVQVLDKRSGKLLFKFGGTGSDDGKLYHPTNLAIAPHGDIYVVETGNFRVSQFTPDGKFVRAFGEAGQTPGRFARPKGIAVDRAGRIYIADAAFQNVQIFDARTRMLMAFGQPPDGSQGLNLPAGVAVDYDNVALFRRYADPKFAIEYVILVVSQFGPNKVDAFGFGKMAGVTYPPDEPDNPNAAGARSGIGPAR